MPFAGIIFDFNGVLWWDAPLIDRGWQRSARQLRGREFTPEELSQTVYGRNNGSILEYLVGHPLGAEEIRRMTDERETYYRNLCLEQGEAFRLSPGAIDLLEYLRESEIPRTIATASEKTNVDFFVRQLRLERWFDPEKIVFDDLIRPGKPAPDCYLAAAGILGLDPSRCVVAEDSLSGIRAACAAGIGLVIGVTTSQSEDALLGAGAGMTVGNLGQIENRRLFGAGARAGR
ncbi:MAG: HAD family phosphatase [Anaerolineales bacterium]|nr:HAD family phosphatase [Anaerolineales bacterium]